MPTTVAEQTIQTLDITKDEEIAAPLTLCSLYAQRPR
jgi:hypothetical protein